MIAERLRDRPAAHRAAALLILALLLWILAPLLTGLIGSWREGKQAVADEEAILQRLQRLDARRAAVGALAAKPEPPFFVATDRSAAEAAITARLQAAALPGAFRLESIQPIEGDALSGSVVRLTFGFTATQGALQAFLAEIETRPPYLKVERVSAAPIMETDGSVTLAGTGAVAAVTLLRAVP